MEWAIFAILLVYVVKISYLRHMKMLEQKPVLLPSWVRFLPLNNDDYLNLYLHNERACPAVIRCESCLDGIGSCFIGHPFNLSTFQLF